MSVIDPCRICTKTVLNDAIQCDFCKFWIHRKCNRLTAQDLINLENCPDKWHYLKCIKYIFDTLPFPTPCEPTKTISQLKKLFRK